MSKSTQVNFIVSLRAIAALMVCFFHFSDHQSEHGSLYPADSLVRQVGYYGHHGVNVFFVISGFVIPLSMYYGKYTIQSFGRFIAKRMVRLHPPFILSMLLYAFMEFVYWFNGDYTIIFDWLRIISNFFLTARIFGYAWFQDVYWTLAIELQYYLLIALLFPLIVHRKTWVSVTTIISLLLTSYFFDENTKHFFFFHASVFVLGITLFLHHVGKITGFQMLLYAFFSLWISFTEITPYCTLFIGLTAAAIYFVHARNKALEWVGEISYSLYLTHAFAGCQLLYYTARYADSTLERAGLMAASFAVSIGFAYLFYRVIEVPSVRWSQRIKYRQPAKT